MISEYGASCVKLCLYLFDQAAQQGVCVGAFAMTYAYWYATVASASIVASPGQRVSQCIAGIHEVTFRVGDYYRAQVGYACGYSLSRLGPLLFLDSPIHYNTITCRSR